MSDHAAQAQFSIDIAPGDPVLEGTGGMDFTKTWSGAMAGSSAGVMLSGGDPSTGYAGYVAVEVFTGTLDGRPGGFALLQFGTMAGGVPDLRYEIASGSGTGDLGGITGVVDLDVVDGVHHVVVRYAL